MTPSDSEPDASADDSSAESGASAADSTRGSTGEAAVEPDERRVGAAVVTVTADGSIEEDAVGDAIVAAFEDAGHDLATRELIRKGYDDIQSTVSRLIDRGDVDVVVTTGGTGVATDDATLEAVDSLLDKEIGTFADLFTSVCYEEVGTGVLCTRALAGVADGVAVFCLPDNVDATRVATTEIVVPESPSIVSQANGSEE